jgi:putative GTP pyrophosphokinase
MIDYKQWYLDNKSKYESLLNRVSGLTDILLRREKIKIYTIQSRVKDFDRFEAKFRNKKYHDPEDMIDFAGLRIVCYLLSDTELVSGMMQDNFEILKREDKTNGYKAIHLDSTLGQERTVLPDYEEFVGLKFEIQVATILQHAYAEIEHDRKYKRDDVLPGRFHDKFDLISSTLVKCDEDLEQLTREIDKYEDEQFKRVDKNKLDIPIDSPSLRRYLLNKFEDMPGFRARYGGVKDREVIEDLNAMKIYTLAEFDKIATSLNFKERYKNIPPSPYGIFATGIVRWILIIHDWKRYFMNAWNESDGVFDIHDRNVFEGFGLDPGKFPEGVRWEWD